MSGVPTLAHDRVFDLQTDAEYLLTGSMTVHFYTFPKINLV
jgi:hypothetical protein